MPKTNYKSVDDYFDSLPDSVRATVDRVRNTILKALPGADESISYNMPTYKLNGTRVLYFAVWKKHYALYGATEGVVAAFRAELAPYEIEKGTVRFPLAEPIPAKLIADIAKFRAYETGEREKSKPPKPKARRG